MSNSNKSDDHQPSNGNEPVEPASEEEDADEIYRNYSEGERPILRSRAQRALRDVTEMFEREDTDAKTRHDVESAIDHLERIVECLADEPPPSISAEALDIEDWIEYDELRYQHGVNGSMSVLLDAFVILVESGVALNNHKAMPRFRTTLQFFVCAGYVVSTVDHGIFPTFRTCFD